MKITKDEARILSVVLEEEKFNLIDKHNSMRSELYYKLTELEEKLEKFGKDQRRTGRTSINDFTDCLKRFVEK